MRRWIVLGILFCGTMLPAAIIIDHNCTNIHNIPDYWIGEAKKLLVAYQHTSHGSQLPTGLLAFRGAEGSLYYFEYTGGGYNAGIFLNDYGIAGASDLGNPDYTAWYTATRNLLKRSGGCDRNVVMWSWCGQADTSAANINLYLSQMSSLETEFPGVKFVYITGHLVGSGAAGNLNQRNEQIRQYCQTNDKILFDFADIESWDPDGLTNFMTLLCNDNCDYDSDNNGSLDKNWAGSWLAANPASELATIANSCSDCAHSQKLNCVLKGRAFWWLMARLAGWNGTVGPSLRLVSPNGGQNWLAGSSHNITWSQQGLTGDLTIDLYRGEIKEADIGTVDVNAGIFSWAIPKDLAPANDYRVHISQGSYEDYSDSVFRILSYVRAAQADFNQDDVSDIVWRHYAAGGGNVLWLMNRSTAAAVCPDALPAMAEQAACAAPADAQKADGEMETVAGPEPTGPVQAIDMLQKVEIPAVADLRWQIGGTGDFNGDGKDDLLWRCYGTGGGANTVWLMDGTSRLSNNSLLALADTRWKICGTADFNSDGKADILWRYEGSGGKNQVWLMNGLNRLAVVNLPVQTNLQWKICGCGDFNGDGNTDILWRLQGTGGKVQLWLMRGTARAAVVNLPAETNLKWRIVGVGDWNKDNRPDILWRFQGSGGANRVWLMNGTKRSSVETVPPVSDLLWKIEN